MPAVPPTYIALDSSQDALLPILDVLPDSQHTPGSPTPDPDLDDGVLVSVITGDAAGAVTQPTSTVASHPEEAFKPHICLSNLSLHSPSAIIGTPFDVSPRFEYPFPAAQHDPSSSSSILLSMPSPAPISLSHTSPFLPTTAFAHCSITLGTIPTLPYPLSHRPERSYSPTHPKHVQKDPPVPPGLVAKKHSIGVGAAVGSHQRKRSRRSVSERDQELARTSSKAAKTQNRRSSGGLGERAKKQLVSSSLGDGDGGGESAVTALDSTSEAREAQNVPTTVAGAGAPVDDATTQTR